MLPVWLLGACSRGSLDDVDRAVRVSMALRGVHPSAADLEDLRRGRRTLRGLARGWTADPRFGDTVRDLHAEQLLVRWDTENHPPPIGPLSPWSMGEVIASLDEEPLRLVERIVLDDRPYGEILTAPTTMADPVVAAAYGLARDPDGPEWQEVPWPDGRPAAGILASTGLWQRHMSSDTNYQRVRANLLLGELTCAPLDANGRGVRFPDTAIDAVRDDPECAACHERLDPVASAFFGFRRYVLPSEIGASYAAHCPEGADCYPFSLWDPSLVATREEVGMPAPAWEGTPVDDLADLGAAVAADPGFARCTARRFGRYLQRVDEPDPTSVERWTQRFASSGMQARALAIDVVLDEDFLAAPRMWVRPEQLARLLPDLTGFAFEARAPDGWGTVDLLGSDEHGLRAVAGGIDGWNSVRPVPDPTPGKELTWAWAASETAARVVATGRFDGVTDPSDVRRELRRLHEEWLAEPDADEEPAAALFEAVSARTADPAHAWTVVLTALLLDDRVVGY